MQTKQGAVLESLRAVDLFLTDNAEQLGDVVRSALGRSWPKHWRSSMCTPRTKREAILPRKAARN